MFMGFYNASEWKTDWCLGKKKQTSVSTVHTLHHVTSALKRTHKFGTSLDYWQESFHSSAKALPPNSQQRCSNSHDQTPCPICNCLKFYSSHAKDYFPLNLITKRAKRGLALTLQFSSVAKLVLKKLYDMILYLCQTLIKSKCAMSVTESEYQTAKHLLL